MFYKINLKKFFIIFTAVILFTAICLPNVSSADWQSELKGAGRGTGLIGGGVDAREAEGEISNLTIKIVQFFLAAAGLTLLILLIYGGFLWMMARGDEAKVTKARDLIEAAVIGLIIILAAYGISYFVMEKLGTITGGAGAGGGAPGVGGAGGGGAGQCQVQVAEEFLRVHT